MNVKNPQTPFLLVSCYQHEEDANLNTLNADTVARELRGEGIPFKLLQLKCHGINPTYAPVFLLPSQDVDTARKIAGIYGQQAYVEVDVNLVGTKVYAGGNLEVLGTLTEVGRHTLEKGDPVIWDDTRAYLFK